MDQDQQIQRIILQILAEHRGFNSRIPRKLLLRLLNQRLNFTVGDRRMRKNIETLRTTRKGMWIVSTSGAKGGYFTARNIKELDEYTREDLSKAYTLLTTRSRQRELANLETSPQMELFP